MYLQLDWPYGLPYILSSIQFHAMQTAIHIETATEADFGAVCFLLSANNLPTADLNPLLENFLLAVEGADTVGVMGIDRYGAEGLLRSAAVMASHRNKGIASVLLQQLKQHAKQAGVKNLYLVTNTAEAYFERKGFKKISREAVSAAVLQSKEFNGVCPASATIMHCVI